MSTIPAKLTLPTTKETVAMSTAPTKIPPPPSVETVEERFRRLEAALRGNVVFFITHRTPQPLGISRDRQHG